MNAMSNSVVRTEESVVSSLIQMEHSAPLIKIESLKMSPPCSPSSGSHNKEHAGKMPKVIKLPGTIRLREDLRGPSAAEAVTWNSIGTANANQSPSPSSLMF